ncbi:acetate--CoA ligase family protein [bacterium]|nr:acetate--CoA ligase family protein [bacterium]
MDMRELLKQAKIAGHGALNEKDAKELLKFYGVPVIREVTSSDVDTAVAAAEDIGFPVVLKGLGTTLLHKTERGLVHLNLCDIEAVKEAATSIIISAGEELEGILVQPYLKGRREFVAGLLRDDLFGPVVMFGLGGVFTETLNDVSFRLAPLTTVDVEEMLSEIRAQAMLGDFRGEAALDRDSIKRVLLGLSQLALDHPDIKEIDINPLITTATGHICAVDALVCFGEEKKKVGETQPVDYHLINNFFYPESIAFIGASPKFQKWGYLLPLSTLSWDFKGKIHLVNPNGGNIHGQKCYQKIADIPGKVDLAVVTIPASGVLDLIPQLKAKGTRNMLIITSGFREIGESGENLEKTLMKEAAKAGILIIGPNTMGICNPHISLTCLPFPVTPRAGSTSLVCQSGNMGLQFLAFAEQQCIGIRGFAGSGNEAMVTIPDYLDAFEVDPLTRIVMLYIESIRDGRRFFESARRVSRKKPVVLLKGGQSRAGKKAASSHTGAIASDTNVFNAACRQAGVVQVTKSRTLLDVVAAFASQPIPKGNRVAIMTLGGGWGVLTADLCTNLGLEIPDLTSEIIGRIDQVLPDFWSRANPVDIVATFGLEAPTMILEELLKWDGCDAVINLGILGKKFFFKRVISAATLNGNISAGDNKSLLESAEKSEEKYVEDLVTLIEKYQKPIFGVTLYDEKKDRTIYPVGDSIYKGLFYPTPARAVEALSKMVEYGRFLSQQQESKIQKEQTIFGTKN